MLHALAIWLVGTVVVVGLDTAAGFAKRKGADISTWFLGSLAIYFAAGFAAGLSEGVWTVWLVGAGVAAVEATVGPVIARRVFDADPNEPGAQLSMKLIASVGFLGGFVASVGGVTSRFMVT